MIWPIWPIELFSGTANVAAPVLLRFPVSQLSNGGLMAKENGTAMHNKAYRALNACDGRSPAEHLRSSIYQNYENDHLGLGS